MRQIGILPDPQGRPDWPQIEAFLQPAATLGNVPVLEPGHAVWTIYGDGLVGACTARLTHDGWGEVLLVGGRDCRRWIHEFDRLCGDWMRSEGMRSVRAYGRKGWARILKNWRVLGVDDGSTVYERAL